MILALKQLIETFSIVENDEIVIVVKLKISPVQWMKLRREFINENEYGIDEYEDLSQLFGDMDYNLENMIGNIFPFEEKFLEGESTVYQLRGTIRKLIQ